MDEGNVNNVRKRKKLLHTKVLDQMEFYFSNSNLTRDKFLRAYVDRSKFVPISVFLSFNKIKCLTEEVEDIIGSIKNSHFLQLSEDLTAVGRRHPFVVKEDADSCTVYVEGIPLHSTEDIIRRTFSAYGTIDYVSMPRNRNTGSLHGFSFVEFRTPNMAHNALQAFGSLGRRIPSEHYPECLGVEADMRDESEPPEVVSGEEGCRNDAIEAVPCERPNKRKLSVDSSSKDTPVKVTRFAAAVSSDTSPELAGSAVSSHRDGYSGTATTGETASNLSTGSRPERYTTTSNTTACSSVCSSTSGVNDASWTPAGTEEDGTLASTLTEEPPVADVVSSKTESAAARRRSRKTRRSRKRRSSFTEEDSDMLSVQIMPLSEWFRYRGQYRLLQKDHFSSIKASLRETSQATSTSSDAAAAKPAAGETGESTSGGNSYTFRPGCVVSIALPDSVSNVKQAISGYRRVAGVAYVDLDVQTRSGYIRFDSPDSARDASTGPLLAACQPSLLVGEAEKQYWSKLCVQRDATRAGRSRSARPRGKDRILRRLWNTMSVADSQMASQSSVIV